VSEALHSCGESNNLASRRLASSAIPNARPYTDTSAEQGDYFLMSENSIKLTDDLRVFLER
jgi:hypothetical protein